MRKPIWILAELSTPPLTGGEICRGERQSLHVRDTGELHQHVIAAEAHGTDGCRARGDAHVAALHRAVEAQDCSVAVAYAARLYPVPLNGMGASNHPPPNFSRISRN
jgi:hypothetical protein